MIKQHWLLYTSNALDDIKESEVLGIQDLFHSCVSSHFKIDFVLVSGSPGIGKSTLVLNIACNWRTLKNYSLSIALIRLRENGSKFSINKNDLFIEKHNNMERIFGCIDETDGEGVLWILDEFDELPLEQQHDHTVHFSTINFSEKKYS